ncbi:MAG: hypothetical protein HY806_06205 [Nitrospirae bacterium]|nr:hypothetical protein [Nitrospirota bacterium]
MKRLNWQFLLGTVLIALSATLYFIHYAIFKDAHHIFVFLLGDIAFVPVEVLLVTLIIHRLLTEREKRSMLKKLNMVIGIFFSEAGTKLLKLFLEFNASPDKIQNDLIVTADWTGQNFSAISSHLKNYNYRFDSQKGDMEHLQSFLLEKRSFLLSLLQNPNLLEHESFTDLLWAVFHLTEELAHRTDVKNLPASDYEHLSGDIKRMYVLLISEWLSYMKHLKDDYPYLFSLAVRTNPFNPSASPVIQA